MDSLEAIRTYCYRYGKRPLVIDTSILILLFIGIFDKSYIEQCPLTASKYTSDDYELLKKIIRYFKPEIIITPHLLAEVSNLSKRDIKDPHFHVYFAKITDVLRHYQEHHIVLEKLLEVGFKLLSRFGFPDMSVIEVAKKEGAVVLTDEVDLYNQFYKITPVMKFSYIKTSEFLS